MSATAAVDPGWFERFFDGLAAEIWRAANPPAVTRAEVDFAADLLDLQPDDPVLDVPCGEGRHSLELARRGYRPTGVDLSPAALRAARAAAAAEGLDIAFFERDMRRLRWPDAFAGLLCLGNAFGYFDRAATADFLAAAAGCLRPGGGLLLHSSMVAETLLPHLEPEVTLQVGDIEMRAGNRYDALAGRLDADYRFQRGAVIERRQASHWILTIAEIVALLRAAGLETESIHGDVDGTPFAVGDDSLFLLARRRA